MKRSIAPGAAVLVSLLPLAAGLAHAGAITAGNLVVVRVGDGSTTLSASAFQASLLEYTVAKTLVQTISIASSTSGNNTGGLTLSGTVTSSGGLNVSTDGKYLTLIGYDAKLGTTNVMGTASSVANRTIARVATATGAVDTSTRLTDAFSGNTAGGVISTDGTKFWAVGSGSKNRGVVYATLGATTSTEINSTKSRQVATFNNTLLTTDTSGNVSRYGSFPTTSTKPTDLFAELKSDANAFVAFNRGGGPGDASAGGADTIYLADGAQANALQKWEWNGILWVTRGSVASPSANGLFGLTGTTLAGPVTLFATEGTASNNTLYSFTDTSSFGNNISGSFTNLVSAGANYTFQGVIFAVPEPGSLALGTLAVMGVAGAGWRRRRARAEQP